MARKVIALFFRSDSVTYLAARGKRVLKWAELPLDAGLVKDGLVAEPHVLGPLLHDFIRAQGIRPKWVIAGISGLHCLTRTMLLPHMQRSVLPEAIRREAELAFPVQIDQLYLSWQTVASTSDTINTFLVASPRNTADAAIKALGIAGIKPQMVDLAPLCISRVGAGITGVLADIRPTEVDIIINIDGVPQLMRSQTYPGEAQTVQEKLLYVKEELERSIDFYDSAHPDKPLDAVAFSGRLPVHVSGKLVQELAACQFLAGELNRSVLPLQSPIKAPHGFPATEFMVNLGLASKPLTSEGADFTGININVLPEEQRPKTFSYSRVGLAIGSEVLAASLVIFSIVQVRAANVETRRLQSQVTAANSQFEGRAAAAQALKLQAVDLNKKLSAAQATYDTAAAKLANLKAVAGGFDAQKQTLNAELDLVTTIAPKEIVFRSVARSGSTTTVRGASPDEATVLAYARALQQSGKFALVVISSWQASNTGISTFTLSLQGKG
ncbi:MAG: pilus assembly protein PilM [Chloroflexi bacterium]|nr:pilus assembly protein PilM [Chloroflexota bacterium]